MKKLNKFQLAILYILSFTWGLPMTLIGVVAGLILSLFGSKPKTFHGLMYYEVGYNWGGVNLGVIYIVNKYSLEETRKHESGHFIQNAILGVTMPFLVSLPSAIRYWLYVFGEKKRLFQYEIGLLCVEMIMLLISIIAIINFNMVVFTIFIIFSVYWIVLCTWVIFKEGKKFVHEPFPIYEEIWFEKSATELGEKYF